MFIDYLTIRQQHAPGTIPDLGDGRVLRVDADGSLEWETLSARQYTGSYDTSIRIRAFDGLVEWSGNPSRWNRSDNVFGYTELAPLLHGINRQIEGLGLPAFSASRLTAVDRRGSTHGSRFSDNVVTGLDGAVITRVDLALNFEAGADAPAVLRALRQTLWQGKEARPFGSGSQWGSRRHTLLKWYEKGPEMLAHKPKTASDDMLAYRQAIADYCCRVGLVRFEVQLGRDALRRLGLRNLSEWSDERAAEYLETVRKRMMPEVGGGSMYAVAERLIELGETERRARILQGVVFEWAGGVDIFAQYPKPTAYRYRRDLLAVGVDIRMPVNVTTLGIAPRVVEMRKATPPTGYRFPNPDAWQSLASVAA